MRVVVTDNREEAGVSRLIVDGVEGVEIGVAGVGDEMWSTNLRSDSS